jgi:anti-sigma regulatory factor (Ser/Thr protein kinase)
VIIGGWRGPGWQVFSTDPRLGSRIRDWIRSAINGHDCPVDAEDAALVAGELFANAVIHGPASGRVLVGYCLWREGARLVVCDGGGRSTPKLLDVGEQAEGGRGLHIVDSLAARWGSFRLAGVRAVWCDLGQPLQAASSDAWAWLNPVLSMRTLSAPDSPGGHRDAGHSHCPGRTMSAEAVQTLTRGTCPESARPFSRGARRQGHG